MFSKLIKYKNFFIVLFITLFIFIAISYFLQQKIELSIAQMKTNIEKNEIENVRAFAKNIETKILKATNGNIYDSLEHNLEKQQALENAASILLSEKYKYLFVLYLDKKNHFRFLLDASTNINEKSYFDEKFILENPKWLDSYINQIENTIVQDDLGTLWITYLYPIVVEGRTEAIIAIDFAQEHLSDIFNILVPLNNIIKYFGLFLLVIFIIGAMLLVYGYQYTKRQYIDTLTDIYNRNFLKEFSKYAFYKDYSIILVDIDNFKSFNDIYGFHIGDEILVQLAQVMKDVFRNNDKIIRYGGEEFIIFLKNKDNDYSSADYWAQKLLKEIATHDFVIAKNKYHITVSIGLNPTTKTSRNIAESIRLSDEALHIAKKSGKNQVRTSQDINPLEILNYDINYVKEAIENNRVINYYQLIYQENPNGNIKYETLVRIIDKNGDIRNPIEFLGSIKNTHVYNDLAKIILSNLDAQFKKNAHTEFSINMEIQDFFNNDFMNMIFNYLVTHRSFAHRLTFELLETTQITNFEFVNSQIERLQQYGAKVSIDDFGCGYSNFIYLLKLNVDYIKIDGSIIQELENDKSNHAYMLIKYILELAESMNIEVVAEHVSDKEIYKTLKHLGVQYYQGYYFGKPCMLDDPQQ